MYKCTQLKNEATIEFLIGITLINIHYSWILLTFNKKISRSEDLKCQIFQLLFIGVKSWNNKNSILLNLNKNVTEYVRYLNESLKHAYQVYHVVSCCFSFGHNLHFANDKASPKIYLCSIQTITFSSQASKSVIH